MPRNRKPPCEHPYDVLSIISGAGGRGTTGAIRVSCETCGKAMAGNEGLVRFVIGMRDEMKRLRQSVLNLGGTVVDPALIPAPEGRKLKKKECLHYLAWLEIAGDKSGARGYRSSNTVKCRNCAKTWPDHTGLLMVMKREIGTLWLEVQRLGGRRRVQ